MVFLHVNDVIAHAQATMEWFTAELREKFKVKSMVETFGVDKTRRILASLRMSAIFPSG